MFRTRAAVIAGVRRYLDDRGFLEVPAACAVLRCAVLRCVVLCWAMPCRAALCRAEVRCCMPFVFPAVGGCSGKAGPVWATR